MGSLEFFCVNRPNVISEIFEDEAVAVNFETGSYFGLSGTALAIWSLLDGAVNADTIADTLAGRYAGDPEVMRADVQRFLTELVEQNLIRACDAAGPAPILKPAPASAWEQPKLQAYEDMKDLLLLDPIHDVDATGWPARKPEAPVES